MSAPWGVDGHDAALQFGGDLGPPDFVYDLVAPAPGKVRDVLLSVGDRGLLLQATPRRKEVAETSAKATTWIRREVRKAVKLAGEARERLDATAPVQVRSRRGYERVVTDAAGWPGVVLVDHPAIPDGLVIDVPAGILVMSLDDWYGLHATVRSTWGVIEYVRRALEGATAVALGEEARRYAALAEADALSPGGPSSIPLLPTQPVTEVDAHYLRLVEEWTDAENAAARTGPVPWSRPDHYRLAVEQIDRLPVSLRVDLGRAMEQAAELSAAQAGPYSTNLFAAGAGQFILFADAFERWASEDHVHAYVGTLAAVRHEQFIACLPSPRSTLLLARLTRADGPAHRTFVFITGNVTGRVLPEARWQIVKNHGIFSLEGPIPVGSLGRNDKCPCLSGMKFKACHLGAL